jgi:hypothetical protein
MNESYEVLRATRRTLAALAEHGLLFEQDRELASVVALVTGAAPRTSWWSHPRGRLVFAVLARLAEHEDVLFTKLLARKVTLVHRRLWPALLAVARARDGWQMRGLSAAARRLLARSAAGPVEASGKAVRELELRLLVETEQRHTESGRHALVAESWEAWARRRRVRAERSLPRARRTIERAASSLGAPPGALPWCSRRGSAEDARSRKGGAAAARSRSRA